MNSKHKLIFYGGTGRVTGSNFVIETPEGFRIMIDCGLIQGGPKERELNRKPFEYEPLDISTLIVTHAHIDHIGRVPKLVHDGFEGEIYSTSATRDIAELMFEDALSVMSYETKKYNTKPIYGKNDVKNTLSRWKTNQYYEGFDVGGGFVATFKNSGHILGSAMIELSKNNKKIVFTGDLGNSPTPLLRDTDEINDADYLVIESVYGDRPHDSKEIRADRMSRIINETIKKKGTLIIPAFSLERTQLILHEINDLLIGGHIPSVPVFLDSPLGIKVTEVYRKHTKELNEHAQKHLASGDDMFNFPRLKLTETRRESIEINREHGAKIIIAGSGMSHGGRIIFHERKYLTDAKNTILLVGYQGAGTIGRQIMEGAKSVRIFNEEVKVRATVETILSYSGHRDRDSLMDRIQRAYD